MLTNLRENIRVALSGLRANKLRSFLTMVGITIGVSAVIVLVSLGQAVEAFVRDQFLGLGTNLIIVFPGEDARGTTVRPTTADARALADISRVPDAGAVMPQLNMSRTLDAGGREALGRIRGVTEAFPEMRSREVPSGTVGGRIAETMSPRSRRCRLAASAAVLPPHTTGWMGDSEGMSFSAVPARPCLRRPMCPRRVSRRQCSAWMSPRLASMTGARNGGVAVVKM